MSQSTFFSVHGPLYEDIEHTIIRSYLHSHKALWSYTGTSNPEDGRRFWFCNLNGEAFFTEESVSRIRRVLPNLGGLKTVYANGQSTNQPGGWHIDSPSGTTVLWYLDDFQENWGGKTLFKANQKIEAYTPKKNTFISFPSAIKHCGQCPSSECDLLRITIAWKFE